MKLSTLILPLTFISLGISAGTLLTSCGKKKKQPDQELNSSGYQATPTDFLRAAQQGNTRALKKIIQQGVDPKTTDSDGRTALHLAAQSGHQDTVTSLLEAGVSINATDSAGATALMLSATQGRPDMLRFLLKQGANPELKDNNKRSALIYAIDASQPACVEELAPYLRKELDTALLYAASQGKYHTINALTSFGASVYTRHDGGMTPLMLAAENGHTTTVHALLQSGSNRFAINEHGWTAAQIAAAANHESIAELLNATPQADEVAINEPTDEEGVTWNETTAPSSDATIPTAKHPNTAQPNLKGQVKGQGSVAKLPTNKRHLPFIAKQTISTQVTQADHPERIVQDLHMRDYQQKDLPLMVDKVTPQAVQMRMLYGKHQKVIVRQGEAIPNTSFKIVSIHRKFRDSKLNGGREADISVVEIEDTRTGKRRQLTTQIPATAEEPWAVLENTSGTQIYAARTGQTFQTSSGESYTVTDIRPTQVLLTHRKTGQVITIPLGQ